MRCSMPARGAQAGRQLGRRRAVRRAQPPRQEHRRQPGLAGAGGRAAQAGRRRHDLRHHRQAGVRDHARDRRGAPAQIVEERGLKQTSDTGAIDAEIDKVLAANADKVAEYKAGKEAAVRLLRRPDDEGDGGQGQPAARQRAAAGETGLIVHCEGGARRRSSAVSCCGWTLGLRRGTRRRMRRNFIAAAAALFATRRLRQPTRRPSSSSSSRSTSSRPTCSTNIGRISPPGWRGSRRGTVFRNGYQSHAATETCPGHSTILTGDHPARTGHHRQYLDRPVDRPQRQERLLRRGRDAARAPARSPTRFRPSICWCRRSAS